LPAERVSIDGFVVTYKRYDAPDDDYETELLTDVTARSTVISRGLHADTQYSFYIQCFNSLGPSTASNVVVSQTLKGHYDLLLLS